MPHNNRISASTALKTNDIWSKTIGYDPYASSNEVQDSKDSDQASALMMLARMSNLSGVESRGGCKRCGMLGHLAFQCRNPVVQQMSASGKEPGDSDESDIEDILNAASSKLIGKKSSSSVHSPQRKRSLSESSSSDSSNSSSSSESEKKKKSKRKHKKDKKRHKHKHKSNKKHKYDS